MIIPAPRLLLWCGAVGVPLGFLCGPAPELLPAALGAGALALVLAVADALAARRQLRGLTLELPAITHLARGCPGPVTAVVRDARRRGLDLRVGLGFPAGCTVPEPAPVIRLAAGPAGGSVRWDCTAAERGCFALRAGYLGLPSPLGLWLARATVPVHGELRVYPDLAPERKRLAALFLNHGPFGSHQRRQRGQGREFESLRDYAPGDSYDTISWKATAKRQRPITAVFQIERTQEVYVIVDTARLSGRGTADGAAGGETILERYLTAALILLQTAQRQGDRFGVLSFSDRIHAFIPARNGAAHYRACRDALHAVMPRAVNPDFDELFTFIRLRLRRRALLLFLTCLDDRHLAETFTRNLALLERQHLVLVGLLRPALMRQLLTGPDPETVPQLYARLAGHLLWHDVRELERELRRRGVTLALLDQAQLCPQLVTHYLMVKQRQAL